MEPTSRRGSGRVLRPGQSHRIDVACVVALLVVAVVIPLALGAAAGSLAIPRNDDWDFRRVATGLWRTGQLVFDHVAEMTLIGQVVLVQPLLWLLRGDPTAFTIAGACSAAAVTIGSYGLARCFLPPVRAVAAALALILFPGFLSYDTSFMSDVPSLAAVVASLVLGVAALRHSPTNLRRLALALALAVLAFSIRQFGLAALGALAVAAIAREPRRIGIWALVGIAVGSCWALASVRAVLPGASPAMPANIWFATRLPSAAASIAFALLPAAVIAIARHQSSWRRRDIGYGAAMGLLVSLGIAAMWIRFGTFPDAFVGNLASQQGVLDVLDASSGRPPLFPDSLWLFINLMAIAALVLVGAVTAAVVAPAVGSRPITRSGVLRSLGTPVGLVTAFVMIYGGGMAAFGTIHIVFDRYLWPLVTPLAVLLLMPRPGFLTRSVETADVEPRAPRPGVWRLRLNGGQPSLGLTASVGTAIQGALAVILMVNAFAFDAARWRAGEAIVAAGVPADRIDAGFEWVGYHATTTADLVTPLATNPPYRGWWKDFEPCGFVLSAGTEPDGTEPIGIEQYRLYLVTGPVVDLHLYKASSPTCAGS